MKMINGVSMIPFGLLAGFADQNEIRIIELAENGFRFRMAKNQKNIENTESFRICFYDGEISDYRKIILQKFHIEKPEEEKFYLSTFTKNELNENHNVIRGILEKRQNILRQCYK